MAQATHELLTPEEAADLLRVQKETVLRYVALGKVTAYRFGDEEVLLFKREELFALLKAVPPGEELLFLGYGDYDPNDPRERAEAIAGIRRGLESPRYRPFEEFAREQRLKHGLSD